MNKIKYVTFSIILFLAIVEITIRNTHLDLAYLRHTLYYSPADSSIYQPSKDANLLYELVPNKTIINEFGKHPNEKSNYQRKISINEYGYRYSPWKKEKTKFRIVIFGGSNTYGASVSDEDTFTFKLFKLLEKKYPNKFEVWNGGLTASVLSQKVYFARKAIKEIEPDLIVFKHFHNYGRRAFWANGKDTPDASIIIEMDYFKKNPELWAENIPFLFNDNIIIRDFHVNLVQIWATYRLLHVLINNHYVRMKFPHNEYANCFEDGENLCNRISLKYSEIANIISEREFKKFVTENPTKKIIMFDPIRRINCKENISNFFQIPIFSLCPVNKPEEFNHIHPPSYVYDYYAKEMLIYLTDNKLIPH